MALKTYRPTSPGRRDMTGSTFEEITKSKPEKSLVLPLKKKAGRNNNGRISIRHRGGGAKRRLRIIDFRRDKAGVYGYNNIISKMVNSNGETRIICRRIAC